MADSKSGTLLVKYKNPVPDELKGKLQIGISEDNLMFNIILKNEDDLSSKRHLYTLLLKWVNSLGDFLVEKECWLSYNEFYGIQIHKEEIQ